MPIDGTLDASPKFWLNLAAESIYNSAEKISKSCETLKTIIGWTFGLFATGGFVITTFGNLPKYSIYTLYSFGIAFFLLTIAYALSAEGQYPVVKEYNDHDPFQIKKVFGGAVALQASRFRTAATITFVGFFFLGLGILIQFPNTKEKKETPAATVQPTFEMKTGVEVKDGQTYIPVTIKAKKNDTLTVSFFNITKDSKNLSAPDPKNLLESKVFYTDTAGNVYNSYKLTDTTTKILLVRASVPTLKSAEGWTEAVKSIKVTIK